MVLWSLGGPVEVVVGGGGGGFTVLHFSSTVYFSLRRSGISENVTDSQESADARPLDESQLLSHLYL